MVEVLSVERAKRRARRAYELAHMFAAMRAAAIAGLLSIAAVGLYRTSYATSFIASGLAATLVVWTWRGGVWKRGAKAGLLAGLPALFAPAVVRSFSDTYCANCGASPMFPDAIVCFAVASPLGIWVARRSLAESSTASYACSAGATMTLTSLLGCATIGLGGVLGIAAGLVAGSVTGWLPFRSQTR